MLQFNLLLKKSTWCLNCLIVVFLICSVESVKPVLSDLDDALTSEESNKFDRYNLEGKVVVPQATDLEWIAQTRVVVDGGQYLGILKSDGSFTINNIPSGSYVVEVTHPRYVFDPTRVEINSKGKIRARALNNVQPSAVQMVNYPLKLRARGLAPYFHIREQWKITDFLFSPMVLMMVLPLAMMLLMPMLMNSQDPETQREMQQSMNWLQPRENLDISEWLTNKLGGGGAQAGASAAKKSAKPKAVKKQ